MKMDLCCNPYDYHQLLNSYLGTTVGQYQPEVGLQLSAGNDKIPHDGV